MHLEIITILAGVIMILLLAEIIIKNSLQLAQHYGVSGTFIGLTILSIGTSIPEIITAVVGSIDILKYPEQINTLSSLIIGANTGSSIFQQNVVIPVVVLLGAVVVIKKNLFIEMGALIGATLLAWIFSVGGIITRLEGFILVFSYLVYLIYLKKNKISESIRTKNNLTQKLVIWSFSLILACFIIMSIVTSQVVDASVILVESLPISASFFGVILLGVASALPELTTSLIAIYRGKKDISAGILIGSSITNPLLALGFGALISSFAVPNVIILYDLPVKIATALLIYFFLLRKQNLSKKEALILMAIFLIYIIVRKIYFPVDF